MVLSRNEKEQVQRIEDKVEAIERRVNKIQNMVIGIAIGIGIGALIFGFISVKQLIEMTK